MYENEQKKRFTWRNIFHQISPIVISPTSTSVTIGLSKRFLIFQLLEKLTKRIEDDPYLNFISILKNYKVLGKILYGTFHEFYRDRNKMYFKNFFAEREVWKLIKEDLEWLKKEYPDMGHIKMTITKQGVIVYDNYKKNTFNLLLMTIHSGTWVPENIQKKMTLTPDQRYLEEDVGTHKIYSKLVLEKSGIWIDSKMSRFACDFNRRPSHAIYQDGQEEWTNTIWKESLSQQEIDQLYDSYHKFYFTLAQLVESYHFNIIFDGHSMKPGPGRAHISFGVGYTPNFYMPTVLYMQKKLRKLGYTNVGLNKPFKGGYIIKWLKNQFPQTFTFSAEVNKCLYMNKARTKIFSSKMHRLAKDIENIFDIEIQLEDIEDVI